MSRDRQLLKLKYKWIINAITLMFWNKTTAVTLGMIWRHTFLFLRFYFILFLDWGRKGERKGEKHQCVVVSHTSPTGGPVCNPGMCPDWELNWRLFGSQASTQSTEPYQPGPKMHFPSHLCVTSVTDASKFTATGCLLAFLAHILCIL